MRQFLRGLFGLNQFTLNQFTGVEEGPPPEPQTPVQRLRMFMRNVGKMLNQ